MDSIFFYTDGVLSTEGKNIEYILCVRTHKNLEYILCVRTQKTALLIVRKCLIADRQRTTFLETEAPPSLLWLKKRTHTRPVKMNRWRPKQLYQLAGEEKKIHHQSSHRAFQTPKSTKRGIPTMPS